MAIAGQGEKSKKGNLENHASSVRDFGHETSISEDHEPDIHKYSRNNFMSFRRDHVISQERFLQFPEKGV